MSDNQSLVCDENKMCAMTCCPCKIDVDRLAPLVNAPGYICESCGRVANEAVHLCKPKALQS